MNLKETAMERSLAQLSKKTAMRNRDKAIVAELQLELSEIEARLQRADCQGTKKNALERRMKTIESNLNGIARRHGLEPL